MAKKIFWIVAVLMSLILVACGGEDYPASEAPAEDFAYEMEEVMEYEEVAEEAMDEEMLDVEYEAEREVALNDDTAITADSQSRTSSTTTKRLIIKEGFLELLTENTENIVKEVSNLAAATGGFILEQRVWESNGYGYATIKLSVPVTEFERSMNVLRELGEVTQDAATGQDVTDEYVDLESRLGNLRATQERLRGFLEDATKVEDVLEINEELTKVEEELSLILGRMNYLADRAAFSSITLTINPIIPTATQMPTATPTPVPQWEPGNTARDAAASLQTAGQNTADFLIWNIIACGPWLLLLGFFGYLALITVRRYAGDNAQILPQRPRPNRPEQPTEPAEEDSAA